MAVRVSCEAIRIAEFCDERSVVCLSSIEIEFTDFRINSETVKVIPCTTILAFGLPNSIKSATPRALAAGLSIN